MYLHEFYYDEEISEIIFEAASNHKVETKTCLEGKDINSSIYLVDVEGRASILSEFPGNCSSLVLSDVQYRPDLMGTPAWRSKILASIDICESLSYGALWITGTSDQMKDILVKEYEFEVLEDKLYNPHSYNNNYFLIKRFRKE